MKYKTLQKADIPQVIDFWRDHYRVSDRDKVEALEIFVNKNHDLSTLMVDENNKIVGTVLASFDGRKAYIQKMAIHKDLRGKGYGKKILKDTIEKLKSHGVLDIRVSCNEKTASFYEKCGFVRKPVVTLQIRDY